MQPNLAPRRSRGNILHHLHPALAAFAAVSVLADTLATDPIHAYWSATRAAEIMLAHEVHVARLACGARKIEMGILVLLKSGKGELMRHSARPAEILRASIRIPPFFIERLTGVAPAVAGAITCGFRRMLAGRLFGDSANSTGIGAPCRHL